MAYPKNKEYPGEKRYGESKKSSTARVAFEMNQQKGRVGIFTLSENFS
jgi:hypothetical protein